MIRKNATQSAKKSILKIAGVIVGTVVLVVAAIKLGVFKRDLLPKGVCKDCNVILISVDALRAKSIPCYGYALDTAPNLCEFAKSSFLFSNHYSQSAYTLDSHLSIFTSLYPISHKVVKTFTDSLSPKVFTLPQILSNAGYRTLYAGPRSDPHFPLNKGLGRGFGSYEEGGDPARWIEFLSDIDSSNKFFVFLHTYELVEPYLPQKETLERFYRGPVDKFLTKVEFERRAKSSYYTIAISYNDTNKQNEAFNTYMNAFWGYYSDIPETDRAPFMQALYEAELFEWDQKFSEFLTFVQSKDLLKNTIIVITADHGESFLEHGTWTHGYNLYNESIKVPLIVYVPGKKGGRVEKLTQSIDIMPSLLYLLGIEKPEPGAGINAFSKVENNYAISEHFIDQKFAITDGKWKLILNQENSGASGSAELYNLKEDQKEERNLSADFPNVASSLEKKLREILYSQPTY